MVFDSGLVTRPNSQISQDTLVASLGADEMRAMHLADVCLVNHPAMRESERCFGLAASAASAAVAALQAPWPSVKRIIETS